MQQALSIAIRPISPTALGVVLPSLVELLRDTVNSGSALGFLAPLTYSEAWDYWLSLRADLHSGTRLLLGAYQEDRLVGSGQLILAAWPNARHRAEIQKVFVSPDLRGQGVGRSLMAGLHDAARQRGRSLLLLNTRRGEGNEQFYQTLGYRKIGVTPGYSMGPGGERYDNVSLYMVLESR